MKKLIYIPVILIVIFACEKENSVIKVGYKVNNAYSEIEISWRSENGSLVSETFEFQSAEDEWMYTFDGKKGDIVYLATRYSDSTSSVNVQILIDGKVYKEKYSENKPNQYVIVSGTIPY